MEPVKETAWHLAANALREMYHVESGRDNNSDGHRADSFALGQWYAVSLLQPYCARNSVGFKDGRFVEVGRPRDVKSTREGRRLLAIRSVSLGGGLDVGSDIPRVLPDKLYRGRTAEGLRARALSELHSFTRFTLGGQQYEMRQGDHLNFFELEITPEPSDPLVREYAELLVHMPFTGLYIENFDVTTGVLEGAS